RRRRESNEDEKESFMESYSGAMSEEHKNSTLDKSFEHFNQQHSSKNHPRFQRRNLHQLMQISTLFKTYLRPTLHNKDILVLLSIYSASWEIVK
ncbi:hypothetical protein HID58_007791, partial [Brassica napus]